MSWLKQFRWYQIIKPKETKDICDALQVGQKTWYLLLVAQILLIPTSLIDVIIIKIVTDKVMIDGNSQLLAPVLFISGGIIILAMGFEALISYHAIRLSQFWDGLMKGRFLRNILFKPLIFFQQIPSGEILYRLLNDLGTLPSYMTSMRWNLLTNIVMAVAMVIVLLYLDMPLALILFVFIPFQIWALRYLGQKCRLLQEQLKLQDQQLLGNLDNITVNAESLKAFAFESHACHNWFSQYRSRLLTERRLMVLQNIFAVLVMRLSSFAFLLSVCFGGYRVATGTITPGTLMAFLIVSTRVSGPIQFFSSYHLNIQEVIMCCRRIRTTWLTYEQNVKPNTLLFSKLVRVAHGHDIKKPKLLHLSGIWFAYPGTKPTICNTNWELPIGQMVKLAGGNGVGKSTLLKLMAGLLEPQVGQICLNKKPYAEINIRTIRHVIIYVSSNSYWFAGNIHDNLCYHVGRSHNINLSYLTGVLEITGVNSLINRLPQGLNTVVTTGGENFSSGERQRLALIRVLLARPSYVLLDEALSSISHDDASDILRQMKSYLGPTTSIVYVHHGVDFNLPNQHNVILDNSNLVMV